MGGVIYFQYLGRTLDNMHNYCTVVHRNIGKAQAVWKLLGGLL